LTGASRSFGVLATGQLLIVASILLHYYDDNSTETPPDGGHWVGLLGSMSVRGDAEPANKARRFHRADSRWEPICIGVPAAIPNFQTHYSGPFGWS